MGTREIAESIIFGLRSDGFRAYLVGGCVRDLLLHKAPKDFDVATNATPDQIQARFPQALRIGAHFGVVLIDNVEVATFRSDESYLDGRHPTEVRFESDPREDAVRRDFAINALFLDPASNEVLDYVGGQADLDAKIVRAIGDPPVRFKEDYLRMLRAVRFAARLNFSIEPMTASAIRELAPLVRYVSPERVREELTRILTEGSARKGLELLDDLGLLEIVLPEVARMKGVEQPPEYHPEGDVWTHTLIMLSMLESPSPNLAWGVLLHDVGKPPTFRVAERIRFDGHVEAGIEIAREIFSRLRFSNDDAGQIEALIANHMKFGVVHQMRESTLKKFMRLPDFDEHLELHRVDCSSSHRHLENYEFVKQKREEYGVEQIAPPPLITGRDLIAMGFKPGPPFSTALSAVEDAQLEGTARTKEDALALATAILQQASEPAST